MYAVGRKFRNRSDFMRANRRRRGVTSNGCRIDNFRLATVQLKQIVPLTLSLPHLLR